MDFNGFDPGLFSRIAFVQDALPFLGGAERVLQAALEAYPQAPIYTLFHNRQALEGTAFARKDIRASYLNRLPGARRNYRHYLPLMPLAIEQLDLREYQVVLSFSYAVAHGVLLRPDQLHLSYTYTPLRQAWHAYQEFLEDSRFKAGAKSWLVKLILHYLRQWDYAAAARVDHFLAASGWVAGGVWRAYRRPAEVLYPPVDIERFQPLWPRGDYFISVARLEPHKKVMLTVEAFNQLDFPLVVIGEGREYARLARLAGPNVKLLGRQPDSVVEELLGKARAFVQAAEEDFGIAAVEAQAAGCPVIAYGKGGALETVVEGETGIFFNEQTADCLADAVRRFAQDNDPFDVHDLRRNAARFGKERFGRELASIVEREWERFKNRGPKEWNDIQLA